MTQLDARNSYNRREMYRPILLCRQEDHRLSRESLDGRRLRAGIRQRDHHAGHRRQFQRRSNARASHFVHVTEHATPALYSVMLARYSTRVEMTATARAGVFRITFPEGAPATLLFQPYAHAGEGFVRALPDRKMVVGYNPVHRIYQGQGQTAGSAATLPRASIMRFPAQVPGAEHRFILECSSRAQGAHSSAPSSVWEIRVDNQLC